MQPVDLALPEEDKWSWSCLIGDLASFIKYFNWPVSCYRPTEYSFTGNNQPSSDFLKQNSVFLEGEWIKNAYPKLYGTQTRLKKCSSDQYLDGVKYTREMGKLLKDSQQLCTMFTSTLEWILRNLHWVMVPLKRANIIYCAHLTISKDLTFKLHIFLREMGSSSEIHRQIPLL